MRSQQFMNNRFGGVVLQFMARSLAAMLVIFAFVMAPKAAAAQGAPDVMRLDPPQPTPDNGKVEIIEFFAYGCGHCATLEPRLNDWIKTLGPEISFRRVPVSANGFSIRGVDSAPIYYTLEAMGLLPTLHDKVFAALNNEGEALADPKVLRAWLQKNGVDAAKYEATMASFSVGAKVMQARKLTGDYQLRSTPTLAVGGRYGVTQGTNPSPALFFAKVGELAAQLSASKKVVK